jgi:hypothetical protein
MKIVERVFPLVFLILMTILLIDGQPAFAQNGPGITSNDAPQSASSPNVNDYFRSKYEFRNPSDFVMSTLRPTP